MLILDIVGQHDIDSKCRLGIIIRRPTSALLDKLLCPPGPGGPAATG